MDVFHDVVRYLNHIVRIKRRINHGKGSGADNKYYYRTLEHGQPKRREAGTELYNSL